MTVDIELEQHPSGSWEKPRRRSPGAFFSGLTRLRRLFVVVAALHLGLVTVAGFLLMPTRVQAERAMVFAVTEEVRKYDGLAFVAESPAGIYQTARSEGFDNWIAGVRKKHRIGADADLDFMRLREKYRQDLGSLGHRQLKLLALLVLAWAGPMATVYAAVRVMEWIQDIHSPFWR